MVRRMMEMRERGFSFMHLPIESCALLYRLNRERNTEWTDETLINQIGVPTHNAIERLYRALPAVEFGRIVLAYAQPLDILYHRARLDPEYLPGARAFGLAVILTHADQFGELGKELHDFATQDSTLEEFRRCFRTALASDIYTADTLIAQIDAYLMRNDLQPATRMNNIAEIGGWLSCMQDLNVVRSHVSEFTVVS